MDQPTLRLVTFPPAWGLPTCGPFGLKLELCLRLLGVPYERVYELDIGKGPKRKSPWVIDGDVQMGDTELILAHIEKSRGISLERDIDVGIRARAHVLRQSLEEHFHQIFEYELLVDDGGFAVFGAALAQLVPLEVLQQIGPSIRAHFTAHLFERGITRHARADIDAKGRADVDALVQILGDQRWFFGDRPTRADAAAFGLLALPIKSGLPGATSTYIRAQPTLVRFIDRTLAEYFPEFVPSSAS